MALYLVNVYFHTCICTHTACRRGRTFGFLPQCLCGAVLSYVLQTSVCVLVLCNASTYGTVTEVMLKSSGPIFFRATHNARTYVAG